MKILSKIKQISKAYTEGIYADTPANRKLGRVGMSYAEYSKKLKDDKEEKADKKYWLIQFDSGEEDIFTEDKMSKEKLVEEACKFAKKIAEANDYDEYKFDIQENTNDWEEEDFDKKEYDWLSIKAKKHNGKYEISVYDWRTHEYIRNDKQKREKKNFEQKIKRDKEKSEKEFKERFGWMEELMEYQKKKDDKQTLKEKQLEIVKEHNPFDESLGEHTWIKSVDDIKTLDEMFGEDEENEFVYPDFTPKDAHIADAKGKVTIYSSHPITEGVFVSPSKMCAQDYAGGGKIYSKEVSTKDVAWIDGGQGQYTPIKE